MPLFLIQIKKPYTMLSFILVFILALYFAVVLVYAMKMDNVLYYEYPTMPKEEIEKIWFYILFWFIFFNKLEKIIQGKK